MTGEPSADGTPAMQRLRLLCDGTPMAVLSSLVLAAVLALGTGDLLDRGMAMAWLAFIAVVMLTRLLLWSACRAATRAGRLGDPPRWLASFRAGLFASGLAWGFAGLFLMPQEPGTGQTFLTVAILGVCASGLSWLSADRIGYAALILPTLIGLAGGFARAGGDIAALSIPVIVLLAAFLLYNAERINRQFDVIRQQAARLDDDREQILRLSRVASQTTNGVIITSPDGKAVWSNQGLTRILGYSQAEMFGRLPFRMLVGRATNPASVDRLIRAFRNGETDQQELQLKTRSGDFVWVWVQISPIRDAQGALINYMGLLADISAEKEAGMALENYLQALGALTDLAADQSLDIDEQLNQALDLGHRVLGMDLAMIVRVRDRKLEVEHARGNGRIELEPDAESMLVGTLAEIALEADTTIRIADAQDSETGSRCLFDGIQCRSFTGCAVELSDHSVRVISLSAREPRSSDFRSREKVFLDLLFQWISGVLERRARQDQLEKLVAQVPGMVYQFQLLPDGTMSFPYTSPGIRDIYEIEPDQARRDAGQAWEKIHPDDVSPVREGIAESARTFEIWKQEYRVVGADGSVRWLHGLARPESLPDGSVLWHGYIRDISERKHAEIALKASERRLRALFEFTPLGIVLNDVGTGKFIETNRRFQELTGFSAEELRHKQFADLCPPGYLEEDRNYVSRVLHDTEQVAYERPMLRMDGTRFIARMHATVLADAAGNRLIWTLIEDVTEQRRMEQELHELNAELEERVEVRTREVREESNRTAMIISVARDAFLMHDETGRIHRVNPALCRLLDMQADELIGQSVTDLALYTTPEALQRDFEGVWSDGPGILETRFSRSDGAIVELEASVGCGEVEGRTWFYAFMRDIGERKRAEQVLRRAKREAEQANAAKTDFLSRMSHELRTPLNAILGFSQLLRSDPAFPEDSEQHDSLSEISDAGQHLLNLVDEVLDLSRIEQGQLDLRLEALRIAPLVEECVSLMNPVAEQRDISVHATIDPALMVRADRTRLKEVLLNLLSNAIKYNRPNGSASITAIDSAPDKIRVEVADTGCGIDNGELDRLFQPFERLGNALDGIEGTGIGLALAKRLVEVMEGEIGVESTAGEGSRFWIELEKGDSIGTGNHSRNSEAPDDERSARVGDEAEAVCRSLLYIEDNPSNMRLVRRALGTRPELKLLEAVDGETGLELVRDQRPDLVLLDLNLPERGGLSVLRKMRSEPALSGIPVIAVTANAMVSDREKGLQAGLDGYVTKPISIPDLIQTIDQVLETISTKA